MTMQVVLSLVQVVILLFHQHTTNSHDEDISQSESATGPPTSNSQPSPWGIAKAIPHDVC